MNKANSRSKLTAIDLFSGCGGISCGLRQAGFHILAAADLDIKLAKTFEHNFPSVTFANLNLAETPPEQFAKLVGLRPGTVDLVAGGPPCQGFSKNVPRRERILDSNNNLLIKTFLEYCIYFKPRMILMENVAEMKNGFGEAYTIEITERLKRNGYSVSSVVLNAADYGVPQRRRRAFFMANRDGISFQPPPETHKEKAIQLNFLDCPAHVTVWEAIGDLPPLRQTASAEIAKYRCAPFSEYQELMRNGQTFVKNHIARALQPKQKERLSCLAPGQSHKDLPARLQVKGGYSGAYGRLTKDMVAPTITRWVFHPGSGRWGHPAETRLISIREIARIQGFPDDFEFVGTYTQQAAQLGNAVPPLLIQKIAASMVAQLGICDVSKNSINCSREIFSARDGNLNVTTLGPST